MMGRQGRVVIPAAARRELGLHEGDALQLRVTSEGLILTPTPTREEAVAAAYGALSQVAPGRSLVDELIAERRAEAAREATSP